MGTLWYDYGSIIEELSKQWRVNTYYNSTQIVFPLTMPPKLIQLISYEILNGKCNGLYCGNPNRNEHDFYRILKNCALCHCTIGIAFVNYFHRNCETLATLSQTGRALQKYLNRGTLSQMWLAVYVFPKRCLAFWKRERYGQLPF